jgi:hypothetical protein
MRCSGEATERASLDFETTLLYLVFQAVRLRPCCPDCRVSTRWSDRQAPLFPGNFLLREVEPVSANVSGLADAGLRALEALKAGGQFTPTAEDNELLERSAKPEAEVHIMILEPVKKLVEAAR